MNANAAFYFRHASVRFTTGPGHSYRAFIMDGQIHVYSESSLARSYFPAALRQARELLAA